MSTLANKKDLSSFGQAALKLDYNFSDLDRISEQVSRLPLESEGDMEKAQQLLLKFGEYGKQIAEGVQDLAKALEEKRSQAERAAQLVAQHAALVEAKHQENQRVYLKYEALNDKVHQTNQILVKFKKPAGVDYTPEEKEQLPQQLAEFDSLLSPLISEAQDLKNEARELNMKTLERNIDSLWQSLESARQKLRNATSNLLH
jgi:hypothetical protein